MDKKKLRSFIACSLMYLFFHSFQHSAPAHTMGFGPSLMAAHSATGRGRELNESSPPQAGEAQPGHWWAGWVLPWVGGTRRTEGSDERLPLTASRPGHGPSFTPAASPQKACSHFTWEAARAQGTDSRAWDMPGPLANSFTLIPSPILGGGVIRSAHFTEQGDSVEKGSVKAPELMREAGVCTQAGGSLSRTRS